jgi:NTP pyrophosphatase (non-canonical NTP hydrolase)
MKFENENKNLIILMEECAEVIQVCSKIMRFGIDDTNPQLQITNRKHLEVELGDVQAMIGILMQQKTVDPIQLALNHLKKLEKLEKWYDLDNS